MNRCVVIHPTGATELQDFHPLVHQRLRGLGYRRFVIQFVRSADQRMLSSAVYARVTPSAWHVSEASRKLWGRGPGAISVFDEHGDLIDERAEAARAESAAAASRPSAAQLPAVPVPESPLTSARTRMRAMEGIAMAHRLRSLAYHWLYLVDRNDGDAAPFDELFADEFELDWTPSGIRTRDGLAAWYRGVSERVLKSSHTLAAFECEALDDGRHAVRLELEWCGFTRELPEQELEATTRHEWTVSDEPSDRFARIVRGTIRVIVPARPRIG